MEKNVSMSNLPHREFMRWRRVLPPDGQANFTDTAASYGVSAPLPAVASVVPQKHKPATTLNTSPSGDASSSSSRSTRRHILSTKTNAIHKQVETHKQTSRIATEQTAVPMPNEHSGGSSVLKQAIGSVPWQNCCTEVPLYTGAYGEPVSGQGANVSHREAVNKRRMIFSDSTTNSADATSSYGIHGRPLDGWPAATAAWRDEETKDLSSELKKLRHDPPPYLDLPHDIFEGVAADGSTSYVPGQADIDGEEEDDDDDVHLHVPHDGSPMTSVSLKRASSTTGTSLSKNSESSMVRIFQNFLDHNIQVTEQKLSLLERQVAEEEKKIEQEESGLATVKNLALAAGVELGSAEHFAIGYLCKDHIMRELFLDCETNEQRLQFIRRYMKLNKLE